MDTYYDLGSFSRKVTTEFAEAPIWFDRGLIWCQHPDNVWSLHGLHECLTRRGETAEVALIKQRLDLAAARADVPVRASCYCRGQRAA